ncbi:hypothetical protein Tco_1438901 [Tanacetum coccineum]
MDDTGTWLSCLKPTAGYEDAIVVLKLPRTICEPLSTLKDMVKALILDKKNQSPAPTPVKAVEESCVTCGGAHSYQTCPATTGNVYRDNIHGIVSSSSRRKQSEIVTTKPRIFNQAPAYQPPVHQGQIYRPQVVQPPAYQAPTYQAPAPQIQGVSKEDFQAYGITTRSGVAYKGPTIPITSSPKVMERETEVTKDTMPPTNNGSTGRHPTYVNEPPEVELKDLPPHLEYAFLEGDDKLPVIIAKDLKNEEKAALIEVLKSHKRAIAWKLSDIKGINPEFCTHKILMEEDYEPTVQHQRRVKEGIILGHKSSKSGIEVAELKLDVIQAPSPDYCESVRSIVYTRPFCFKFSSLRKMLAKMMPVDPFAPRISIVVIETKKELANWPPIILSKTENPHQITLRTRISWNTFSSQNSWIGLLFVLIVPHGLQDFANLPCGNFIVKGMSSQPEKQVFQRCQTLLLG